MPPSSKMKSRFSDSLRHFYDEGELTSDQMEQAFYISAGNGCRAMDRDGTVDKLQQRLGHALKTLPLAVARKLMVDLAEITDRFEVVSRDAERSVGKIEGIRENLIKATREVAIATVEANEVLKDRVICSHESVSLTTQIDETVELLQKARSSIVGHTAVRAVS